MMVMAMFMNMIMTDIQHELTYLSWRHLCTYTKIAAGLHSRLAQTMLMMMIVLFTNTITVNADCKFTIISAPT
jgi:hypothetical protein